MWIYNDEATTSIVVYGELTEYLKSFPDFPRHQATLRMLLRKVRPYPLTYALLEQYADLRRAMRPPHGPGLIGDIDTIIAATALHYGLTLVTTDGDFTRRAIASQSGDGQIESKTAERMDGRTAPIGLGKLFCSSKGSTR